MSVLMTVGDTFILLAIHIPITAGDPFRMTVVDTFMLLLMHIPILSILFRWLLATPS